MKISMFPFGVSKDQKKIEGYKLENKNGYSLKVINYGATVISFKAPDMHGNIEEIQVGLPDISSYENYSPYLGATIGRVANRIQNGQFLLANKTYKLNCNENHETHLHGGTRGFDKAIWNLKAYAANGDGVIECSYVSLDNDEGYPGQLSVIVTYMLSEEDEMIINYQAKTTKSTPVNLTNHTYWNLSGDFKRSVLQHQLKLQCSRYLETDIKKIPTGRILNTAGSVLDFNKPKELGRDIDAVAGYDHCYLMRDFPGPLKKIAEVTESKSGRVMEVATTEPAVQLFTGNNLNDLESFHYKKHDGLCLETQRFPDAVNHKHFPSIILNPGEKYHHETVYRFSLKS